MSKPWAVEGCTWKITPSSVSASSITVVTPPDLYVFAENKGVYRGTLTLALVGVTQGGYTVPAPVLVTVTATGANTLASALPVALQGDFGNGSGTGVSGGSSVPITFTIEVDDAGQTSVYDE